MCWDRPNPFHAPENVQLAKTLLADSRLSRTAVARRFGVQRNTLCGWFPEGDPDAYDSRNHRPLPMAVPDACAACPRGLEACNTCQSTMESCQSVFRKLPAFADEIKAFFKFARAAGG